MIAMTTTETTAQECVESALMVLADQGTLKDDPAIAETVSLLQRALDLLRTIESDTGRVMTWGAELHAAAKASDWPHVGYLAAAIATVSARVALTAEQAEHV